MDVALDHERCYRAVASRDARFDGSFYTAVRTTGIYCRPSCPAITPKRGNVTFFRTAAAAQRDGFRACRRCRPDAVPGSAEWNVRGDVVARSMRLVADGAVERVGVAGVAAALGYSERHLNRLVTEELGAGLLAIARTQRAHTARILLETTDLPVSEVAWAAGFGSIRSFNDTIGAVYGESPTMLRTRRARGGALAGPRVFDDSGGRVASGAHASGDRGATGAPGSPTPAPDVRSWVTRPVAGAAHAPIRVRLATRQPFDAHGLLTFLGQRSVAGLEEWDGRTYRRTLALPHGHATVACEATPGGLLAEFRLADLRDLAPGVARVRRLFDLDADPVAIAEVLGSDPMLGPLLAARPGLRVAGCVDPHEIVVRAIVGQQVSLAGAATVVGRFVAAHGESLGFTDPTLTHVFPTVDRLAEADPSGLSMPRARGAALVGICRALADGDLVLDPGVDRTGIGADLQSRPGIGPWTAAYITMRGLGDPDVMLAGDLGVRHAVAALGGDDRTREIERAAHAWRPWRSYAVAHLWASLERPDPDQAGSGPVPDTASSRRAVVASATVPAGRTRPVAEDWRQHADPGRRARATTHDDPAAAGPAEGDLMTRATTTTDPAALRRRTMSTPIGPLELVAGPAGLRAVLWPGEDGSRVARAVGSMAPPDSSGSAQGPDAESAGFAQAEAHLDRAEAQLAEYFAGTRRTFDLDLDPAGTDFQLRAWSALRTIPYAQTISYGEQAAELGEPGAARAVGAANGRNPLSIVVPCHRVVAASGALTGFAGGLDTKAWLLDHERTVLAGLDSASLAPVPVE